jgi:putative redox protein
MTDVTARIGTTNYAVEITAGNHALAGDEGVAHGGRDVGPAPYDLLLAGLGACTVITLRMYAERKGWIVPEIEATLVHRKEDGRSHIQRTLRLEGPLTDEQRQRLAEIAEKTPVTLTLKAGADILTRLEPRAAEMETPAELDERLDEALEESFPASDPVSVTRRD